MWESRIIGYETINPEQVLANPMNFRTHPESQAAPMRAVLSDVGIVQNIIINRTTGHLIDGHLRVMEALKAGQSELPATIVELSPDEEKLILATYDHLSSLAGIDVAQLDSLLRDVSSDNTDIQAMISEFAESEGALDALMDGAMIEGDGGDEFDITPDIISGEIRPAHGDIWLIDGKHRLGVGDSTDPDFVARLLDGCKPDLCVTDPPYGVEYDPSWRDYLESHDIDVTNAGLVQNDHSADWNKVYKLFDAPVLYIWHADRYSKDVQVSLESVNYKIISQIIWCKEQPVLSRGDYNYQHEPCLYAVKKGHVHQWQGAFDQSTVWHIQKLSSARTDEPTWGHGTQKPLECMTRPILNNSAQDMLVVDPFLGTGTTLIAAHRTKRICYGCEIDLRYAEIILRRAEAEGLTVARIEENVTTTTVD